MIVITSGCATFEPWASALGGVVGGLIVLPSSLFVSHVLKIDDPVDAFAVRATAWLMHTSGCLPPASLKANSAQTEDAAQGNCGNLWTGTLLSADVLEVWPCVG